MMTTEIGITDNGQSVIRCEPFNEMSLVETALEEKLFAEMSFDKTAFDEMSFNKNSSKTKIFYLKMPF